MTGSVGVEPLRSTLAVLAVLLLLAAGSALWAFRWRSLRGRPAHCIVAAGTVVFATEDGSLLMPAPIDLDGNYRLQNPPVGKMRVSVETLMYKDTKPLVGRIKPGKDTPINSAASPMMNVPKYVHIPEKYEKHDTSGLTYDVKRGKFEWNIELE